MRIDQIPEGKVLPIAVGVCEAGISPISMFHWTPRGWGICINTAGAEHAHDGKFRTLVSNVKPVVGLRLGVLVDMGPGSVAFSLNGRIVGQPYQGLSGMQLVPAFSVYEQYEITVMQGLQPPSLLDVERDLDAIAASNQNGGFGLDTLKRLVGGR
jgi:hypothetical protein